MTARHGREANLDRARTLDLALVQCSLHGDRGERSVQQERHGDSHPRPSIQSDALRQYIETLWAQTVASGETPHDSH